MMALVVVALFGAADWTHPAGLITEQTLSEVRAKIAVGGWAQDVYAARRSALGKWVEAPSEKLRAVFPRKRGNVYHNFSCPDDRTRLDFDPFTPSEFRCSTCNKTFPAETDAGIYKPDDSYHGTMYDGWICMFYQNAASVAVDLAVVGQVDGNEAYLNRAEEILLLFAEVLPTLKKDLEGQYGRILTYHREGDNKILNDLAVAYELLRARMDAGERARVERDVLERLLNDIMLDPIYTYDHNNVYAWHWTILQTALALEREDLVDWCFGYGDFAPERQPEHRSLRRIVATHFKPDGAFWEMCSGYHLYPMHAFCNLAVLSHNLVRMDPERFPADKYDFSTTDTEGGRVLSAALWWFLSMAMPDRTMTVVGDSTISRSGMADYYMTAEVGYRYLHIDAIGDYEALREGKRTWEGLLFGAPEIRQHYVPYTSSYLSSGWVSLRNDWDGNRVWVGVNGLIPGGGHQHADRLTLALFSQGKLLALEKATPYNESVTRVLGTLSPSHSTVTVDEASQKQGEKLEESEIPVVKYFFSGSTVKFTEVRADKLYEQTEQYRRSVAVIEDVTVDCFRVKGGAQHDWMVNHAGALPEFSMPMRQRVFSPKDWVVNGREGDLFATTDGSWTCSWTVDDVGAVCDRIRVFGMSRFAPESAKKPAASGANRRRSRLTLLGSPGTEVYALQTYPIDNAVITEEHPPCSTLCVRRHDDAAFIAVWDAWKSVPNLRGVTAGKGNVESMALETGARTYYVLMGPGEADFDGVHVESDAAFAVFGGPDMFTWIDGTRLTVTTPDGTLRASIPEAATVAAEWQDGVMTVELSGDIQYDTVGGRDRYRDAPERALALEGDLWRVREARVRFAGNVSRAKVTE